MKSHQYASKRRLTNICCMVVGLAFVKLVFAGYLAAGGELFAFPSPEKATKAQQIAEAQAKKMQAYQEAAQNYEQTQKNLAQAVSNLEAEKNSASTQSIANNTSTRQNVDTHSRKKAETQNNINTYNNNELNQHSTQNFALGNDRLQSQNSSRVSFLPQSRNKGTQETVNTNQNTNNDTNKNTQKQNHTQQAQNIHDMQAIQSPPIASQTYTPIERSDMVNDDLILASASHITANSTRSQMRANLMESAFANYENSHANMIDTMQAKKSDCTQNKENNKNTSLQQNIANAPQSSSFFNLVGTAYASDVPYTRPDEATSVPLPSPTVQGYSSPDSLEYKQSELNRKEEELLALQQQMNSRLKELNELEGRIGNMVQDASSMQGEKFKHLIETYTNMKARVAAQSLVTLDEDIAVRILSGMKSKQSGEIFSYMNPVQAARLSEAMAQFNL